MYAWLWHRLPGGWPARTVASALLLVLAVVLLFAFVFPWADEVLDVDRSTVGAHGRVDR